MPEDTQSPAKALKRPSYGNQYTSKKAQRIDWVRQKLMKAVEAHNGKLSRDVLIACKMLLVMDGVGVEKVPEKEKGIRGPRKPAVEKLKMPALLGQVGSKAGVEDRLV